MSLVADLKVFASDADRLAKALAHHADDVGIAAGEIANHQQHQTMRELHALLHRAQRAAAEVARSIEHGLAGMPPNWLSTRR